VQQISSIVLVRNRLFHVCQPLSQLISFVVFAANLSLQLLHLCVAVVVQARLVLLELHKLVVQHLDLLFLGGKNVFVVSFESEVVHFSVTFVAYSVHFRVVQTQLTSLVATGFADGTAASLAVLHRYSIPDLELVSESHFTELAAVTFLQTDAFLVEIRRQRRLVKQPIVVGVLSESGESGGG